MSKDDDNNGWKSVYSGNLPEDREDPDAEPARVRDEEEQPAIAPLPPRARSVSPSPPDRPSAAPARNAAAVKPESAPEPEEEEDEDDEPPKKGHAGLWSFLIALGLVVIAAASILFLRMERTSAARVLGSSGTRHHQQGDGGQKSRRDAGSERTYPQHLLIQHVAQI
ncbi:hypothetical protein [Cohnella ginsengisoli]|uniref:hypothetical protein n=1 Tax=Cohnella ginsengisoli TaxID=425004 RepID=UPI0030B8C9A6